MVTMLPTFLVAILLGTAEGRGEGDDFATRLFRGK